MTFLNAAFLGITELFLVSFSKRESGWDIGEAGGKVEDRHCTEFSQRQLPCCVIESVLTIVSINFVNNYFCCANGLISYEH